MLPQRLFAASVFLSVGLGAGPFAARATAPNGTTALTTVAGRVVDLATDSSGELLFCTLERDVGRIDATGTVTILADQATGPFGQDLRGVLELAGGDIAVIDFEGDILRLPGGATPAVLDYDDLFLIMDVTDFVVDTNGNYVVTSHTPSNGVRGMNHIKGNGGRWAYYLVEHQPMAVTADPLTGGLLMADESGGGIVRLIDVTNDTHPAAILDASTLPGFDASDFDGKLVCETDGDFYFTAGGTVYRHDRTGGTTSVFCSGLGQLTGLTIAPSSNGVVSSTGFSLFVAEGANPTTIQEIPEAGAPASAIASSTGTVPDRGIQQVFWGGIKVFGMTVDNDGHLIIGGDLFRADFQVRRVEVPSMVQSTVALESDGLASRIKDVEVAPDGTIYSVGVEGEIHAITESPFSVTEVYGDGPDVIDEAWALALRKDGTLYVGDREGFGPGEVLSVSGGVATELVNASEARGLFNDQNGCGMFVVEWNATGFDGSVAKLDLDSLMMTDVAGFERINYANSDWGDGDLVLDAAGSMYTCSKDDWRVTRFDPKQGRHATIGSSYLNNPSGLAIAQSTGGSGSTTGWSLYVAEQDQLWEIPSTPPPAPRLIDCGPPAGEFVGFFKRFVGKPGALACNAAGDTLFVATDSDSIEAMSIADGTTTTLADAGDGLVGELVALALAPSGVLIAAEKGGVLYEVDPATGVVTILYDDATNVIDEVVGLTVEGDESIVVSERRGGTQAGRLLRLNASQMLAFLTDPLSSPATAPFELLAYTARGLQPAVDPLTGEIFVSQEGHVGDDVSEMLRVDGSIQPTAVGDYKGSSYYVFDPGPDDGGLVFDDTGAFYVAEGEAGVVSYVDRSSGDRMEVAGNYHNPSDLVLAPGRAGSTGPLGTSLFVLDGWSVYEVAVDELPAPPAPLSPPGLASVAELRARNFVEVGLGVELEIEAPAYAGEIYAILPSILGKHPGIPTCAGVIPGHPASQWLSFIASPSATSWIGVLDGSGKSSPGVALTVPNTPEVLDLNVLLDLAWVVVRIPAAGCLFEHIGGTTHIWVGD